MASTDLGLTHNLNTAVEMDHPGTWQSKPDLLGRWNLETTSPRFGTEVRQQDMYPTK